MVTIYGIRYLFLNPNNVSHFGDMAFQSAEAENNNNKEKKGREVRWREEMKRQGGR